MIERAEGYADLGLMMVRAQLAVLAYLIVALPLAHEGTELVQRC